jgi:hypothetical protein
MATKFELKDYLTNNREMVIAEYNKLTTHKFFNGVTLKAFMVQVYNLMAVNNPKSEKRADSLLSHMVSQVVVNNSKVDAIDKQQDALVAKYQGTAFMAMV